MQAAKHHAGMFAYSPVLLIGAERMPGTEDGPRPVRSVPSDPHGVGNSSRTVRCGRCVRPTFECAALPPIALAYRRSSRLLSPLPSAITW